MAIGVRSEPPGSRDAAGAAEAITEVTQGIRLKYEPTVQQISATGTRCGLKPWGSGARHFNLQCCTSALQFWVVEQEFGGRQAVL